MDIPIPPRGVEGYGAIDEVFKLLKKEEKKGAKATKLKSLIDQFCLTHEKVKEEITKHLKENGLNVPQNSPMIDEMIFALSHDRIFEHDGEGREKLKDKLKKKLQTYSSESNEAKIAVADQLSEGSKMRVPTDAKVVTDDINYISLKTVEDPSLLFDGMI